jgi:hypothetical protein
MRGNSFHLSDEDLLLHAEEELPLHRAAEMKKHLEACSLCRARSAEMESTLQDFVRFHRQQTGSLEGALPKLRNHLVRQMSKEAIRPAGGFRLRFPYALPLLRTRMVCGMVLLVVALVWTMHGYDLQPSGNLMYRLPKSALPVRMLTPGATRPVAFDTLCQGVDPEDNGPIDDSVAMQVFREYGLPASSRNEYEVDYLITPGLGGSNDIRNLWPEPYSSTEWNAHVKDLLESYLHQQVCEGKMSLAAAQNEIAADWIDAYKKHFHTERPLRESAMMSVPPMLQAVEK